MADDPRKWADIDWEWLQNYLEEHELASEFDLEDKLLGAQVSWILGAEAWSELRGAWEELKGKRAASEQFTQAGAIGDPSAAADKQPESAIEELGETTRKIAELYSTANEAPEAQSKSQTEANTRLEEEVKRMHELTQNALDDWAAFRELFENFPNSTGIDRWETLAASPLALFEHAEKLIRVQEQQAEAQKKLTEREFEEDVSRVQNIIVGYQVYCRKHRLRESLEHLKEFIPEIVTRHSPEVVEEAWRQQTS